VDRAVEVIPGLEGGLVERLVDRLRRLEPSSVAVVVIGSYARGTSDEDSDVDLRAITRDEPSMGYRTWFVDRLGIKPLHVSAGAKSVEAWLARGNEPQAWALGFPALYEGRYAWATTEARDALGDPPSNLHPPESPELEDFVETLVKARRCARSGDAVGNRFYAHGAALLAVPLLRPLNDDVVVTGPREALDAALSFPIAPEHYREDLRRCMGVVPARDDEVEEAALRLGRELLALLRERKPDIDSRPEAAGYLADGTFERHLGFN
jgi:hypothetical protein